MNILWVLNKYVEGGCLSRYYPDFLKGIEEEVERSGNKIYFIFFSEAMRDKAKTKNNIFYKETRIKNAKSVAKRLEKDYEFTFKQAYFAEIIQVSKLQDYRKINLPTREFEKTDYLVGRYLYLEKIIDQMDIDAVFCDQSAEAEMEFARSLCHKKQKIFLRYIESFLGRSVFLQQFAFGKERVALPLLDKSINLDYAKNFVDDFVKNDRLPYIPKPFLKANFREYYLPRLFRFYQYPQFIKIALMQPYLYFEDKILKGLIRSKFDEKKPYFYFGFHLPTESTVALRALPFMTQTALIESFSRVLPSGYYLYVREHPSWKTRFPYYRINRLKRMPNVKLISTEIPISKILKHCSGVLTYNATTGIEALMYGKPVLSFAPNVYSGLHPAAEFCTDLYEAGAALAKLADTKVNKIDTYKYIYKLTRSTSDISLAAGTFLSQQDSVQKASKFSRDLLLAIKYCQNNSDSR
jgi:hypothetical protein